MAWHPPPRGPRRPLGLMVALLVYGLLALMTIRDMGVVGEVAQSWQTGRAGAVVVGTDPLLWSDGAAIQTAGHTLGPLIASQSRPIETLEIFGLALPLAVNQYTGGPPDWPARLLVALTGSTAAPVVLHVLLGALLIVLVHRFLRFHGTDIAATVAALVLATDWGFHFYRKALGGTEILLQAAVLLCLWALWSRRWAGGRHGLTALGIGLGLGVMAKLTFVLSFLALGLAALGLRNDKPPLRPPLPARPWMPLLWVVLLISPLMVAALHHALAVPATPHIVSHDFVQMQLSRVMNALSGGASQERESIAALWAWLGDPSLFLKTAWGAQVETRWHSDLLESGDQLRWLGWGLVGLGVLGAWRDRHPTPHLALLRLTSVLLVLQVALLWGVAKDMHHLAMATPIAAIVAGLALDTLMASFTPPRSPVRAGVCLLLATPWMLAGGMALMRTDAALETIPRPTVTQSGQSAIVDLLESNNVQRVMVIDYDLAGVLEPQLPGVEVIHGWGLASQMRKKALAPLLGLVEGGHLLVVPGAPAWRYNLKPRMQAVQAAASSAGLEAEEADRLPDGGAVLYALSRREGSP